MLVTLRKKKKECLKWIKSNQELFKNGVYKFTYVFYSPQAINSSIYVNILDRFNNPSTTKIRYFIKQILNTLFLVPSKVYIKNANDSKKISKFEGDLLILTANPGVYKIFDIKKEISLTYNPKTNLSKLDNYLHSFKRYFNTSIDEIDSELNLIFSKYIIGNTLAAQSIKDKSKYVSRIFAQYKIYIGNETLDSKISPRQILDKLSVNPYFKKHYDSEYSHLLKPILHIDFPTIILHGDMHLDNILIDSQNKIYFIDFDLMHPGIFFEDIFTLYSYLDHDFLKNLKISQTQYLKELFLQNKSPYDTKYIHLYYIISTLSRTLDIHNLRKFPSEESKINNLKSINKKMYQDLHKFKAING